MKLFKTLLMATTLSILLIACGSSGGGGGGGGGNTPSLVGNWDLNEVNDGNQKATVPSGTFTITFTESTYNAKNDNCEETGTYTANGSNMTLTVTQIQDLTGNNTGDCGQPGDIGEIQYNLTSTTFTIIDGVASLTWNRL